jgi:tRNA1(Val) A37 N6-methylase TrmN6
VSEAARTTIDAFLGGRVEALQPATGHHRSGLDAVLLAAALDERTTGAVVDLGAGAGVAGLCVAARCPEASVILVERERQLAALAGEALRRPANAGFAARVSVIEADIAAPEAERAAAGLSRGGAGAVIANPPFHRPGAVRVSPAGARAAAHVLGPDGLDPWFRAAAWLVGPGGLLVFILSAGALGEALACAAGRFGGVRIVPVHPRPDAAATRILIAARKGSRAGAGVLPGLVLHGPEGSRFLPPVEAVLRGGAGLAAVHPAWRAVSQPAWQADSGSPS